MSVALLIDKHIFEHPKRAIRLVGVLAISLIVAYIANSIFGFTYIYENKRLESIERITSILGDSSLPPEIRTELENDLNRVVQDGSYLNRSLSHFSNSSINPFTKRMMTDIPTEKKKIAPKNIISDPINAVFYILCCSGLYFWVIVSAQRQIFPEDEYWVKAAMWIVSIWAFLFSIFNPYFVLYRAEHLDFNSAGPFFGFAFLHQIATFLSIIIILPIAALHDWFVPSYKRFSSNRSKYSP